VIPYATRFQATMLCLVARKLARELGAVAGRLECVLERAVTEQAAADIARAALALECIFDPDRPSHRAPEGESPS
jgi:hypothetical protein